MTTRGVGTTTSSAPSMSHRCSMPADHRDVLVDGYERSETILARDADVLTPVDPATGGRNRLLSARGND